VEKTENDKRYQKTKVAIEDAIEKLYEAGKNLSQITVSEITNLANITRKTFYLHYQSVNDFILEQIIESADGFVSAYLNSAMPLHSTITDLYKAITKSTFNNTFLRVLIKSKYHQTVFFDRIKLKLKAHIKNYTQMDDYALEFIVSGLTSTYLLWLSTIKTKEYMPAFDDAIKKMVTSALSLVK